jgi:hypothetical protein
MKLFALLFLIILSSNAFARRGIVNIENAKTRMTAKIDQKILDLQNAKTCIQAATTHDQLKQCHQALKAAQQNSKSN